jgi:hypothetical protein
MTTLVQYVPKWLRVRLLKPLQPKPRTPSKKDRQVLPTLARPPHSPIPVDDDGAPLRFRVYWRM